MAENDWWPYQTPLDRERLRLENQDPSSRSGGLLGCLVVGLIWMLVLLLVLLLSL